MLMPGVQTVQESPSWLSNNGEVLNEDDKEEDNEGLRYIGVWQEAYLGTTVNNAVVTVSTTRSARRPRTPVPSRAMNVLRITNEPTATAIAYGPRQECRRRAQRPSSSISGRNFDILLLTVEEGTFEGKAAAGDAHLGGEDFDNSVTRPSTSRAASPSTNDKGRLQ